jgi:bacteriophage CI repressor helix-turn-helix domain
MSVIDRIVELLQKKGVSQADICNYIGIKYNVFTTWKTRETDPPTKYLVQICEFLNITLEYLLTGEESKSSNEIHLANANETTMLNLFRMLSEKEQDRIIGRLENMVEESQNFKNKDAT